MGVSKEEKELDNDYEKRVKRIKEKKKTKDWTYVLRHDHVDVISRADEVLDSLMCLLLFLASQPWKVILQETSTRVQHKRKRNILHALTAFKFKERLSFLQKT